jgi:uncharacterized protein (TIGR02231 family)
MKKTLSLLACLILSQIVFGQNNISTNITHVTVFTRGAELTHDTQLNLNTGKQTLVFGGLSHELDPNSIVIEVEQKTVSIQSVAARTNYLATTPDSKRSDILRDSLRILDYRIKEISAEQQVLNHEQSLLFQNEAIGGTSKGVLIGEIEKAANFYRQRSLEISKRLLFLEGQVATLRQQKDATDLQLKETNSRYNPPVSEITIVVDSKTKQNAHFTIKYVVPNAGWAPKYDVRANNLTDPVQLIYRANVFNNCGLAWNDVNLTLSTSDPMLGAEKPKLEAWDVADNRNTSMMKLQEVQITSLPGVSGNADYLKQRKDNDDVKFDQVAVQELSADFEIPMPYTIVSDNKPYVVDVTEYSLPAKFEHYAAPKADPDAFLIAKVTGWNNLNLASGKASVYFNGTYLGQSFINTASVDDTLHLSLGRDKRLLLQRKKESELSKHQFIGNNEKETFYYETTIRNNRDNEVIVTLEDQLPISSNGDIVVDVLETSLGTIEKNTGKVTWKINLKQGESKTVRLGYSIKSPKGVKVAKTKFRTVACPSF